MIIYTQALPRVELGNIFDAEDHPGKIPGAGQVGKNPLITLIRLKKQGKQSS